MTESATILIPDISGFTTFVARTELEHSAHIVTELLDVLAAANTTGLTLSEVEGDALLLYRKAPAPSVDEVVDQCIEMFVRFHECLAAIERDSVCPCGACQTASGLGVKFVVHFGEIQEISVAGFSKAAGLDIIIAHKLLKTNVPQREHILITEAGAEGLGDPTGSERLSWEMENTRYHGIGEVRYQVASLESLLDLVPEVPPRPNDVTRLGEDSFTVEVDRPMAEVHRTLLDIDTRDQWISSVLEIEHGAGVPRLGFGHVCRFEGITIEFETVGSEVGESEIVYVDQGLIKEFNVAIRETFSLRSLGPNRTEVTLEIHWPGSDGLPREVKTGILEVIQEAVQLLKQFCELPSEPPDRLDRKGEIGTPRRPMQSSTGFAAPVYR